MRAAAASLAIALVAYNNACNFWPPFHRWAYVPANLLATAITAAFALGPLGLTSTELGIGSVTWGDLACGALVGAALAAPLLVATRFRRTRGWVADKRVAPLRGAALAYQTLIRVPLGTALLEEIAFRGALFAAWRSSGFAIATVVSSVAFGLWHVGPSLQMVRVNRPGASGRTLAVVVLVTVVLTTLAGVALVVLRRATGSLGAPFALHAVLNSLATLAGAVAGRATERA